MMASLLTAAGALLCLAGRAAAASELLTPTIRTRPGVAGPQNAPTLLARGQSMQDSVDAFAYQYYLYNLPCTGQTPCVPTFGTWTLTVSPISGNPNVYVNVIQSGNINPATSDYNSSAIAGIDVIQISQSDPRLSALCAQYWNPQLGDVAPCPLYIRVTGAPQGSTPSTAGTKAAQYVISASDSTSGNQLINGVPFIGVLTNPGTQNFTFAVSQSQLTSVPSVQFTVAPLVGFGGFASPSLVVSALPGLPDPSANTSCVGGVGALSGLVQLVATPASPCWCAPSANTPCTYYVGLYPSSAVPSFQYALTASTNQSAPVLLLDGVQTAGYGTSAVGAPVPLFQFNAYWNLNNSRVVRIVESPLRGTIQLFATLGDVNNIPTPNNFDYSATRISGQNEMVIRILDPLVQAKCGAALANPNVTCPILISAVILTQRASFNLEARQSAVFRLSPGSPVEDYVFPLSTTYYYVKDVNYGGNFEVAMTPQSNQFTSVFVGSDAVPGTNFPTPNVTGSFCKSASSISGPAIISIPPNDPCFCTNATTTCNYYIGVSTGRNASAEYTILAKYSGGYQLLQLNVPTSDIIPGTSTADAANGYAIFYPESTRGGGGAPAQSVTFSVDTVPGSGTLILGANVCIANSTFPGGNNPLPCNWNTLPTSQSTFDFFSFVASTDSNGQLQVLSSSNAFQQKCLRNLNTLNYNGSCILQFYVVRVYNAANPSSIDSVYTITPYGGLRQLIDGQVVSGGTPAGNYSFFRFTVIDLTRPLTITVAPITGDPELLVGLGFYPNLANNSFVSYTQGAEVVTINWDSPFVQNIITRNNLRLPFDVNIAVYAVDGPTTYDIDATTNGIQNLQLSRAVAGFAGPQSFQYYYFQIPANFTRLNGFRLDFVASTGNTPVVLLNGPRGAVNPQTGYPLLPRCANTVCDGQRFTSAQYSNQGAGSQNAIIIDPTDFTTSVPTIYPTGVAGVWAVGVYAQAYTEFLITLSALDGVLQVQDGIPTANSIRGNGLQYYSLSLLGQFDYVQVIAIVTGADRGGVANQVMNIFASTVFTNRRPNATQLTARVPGVFGTNNVRGSQRFALFVNSTSFNSTANQQQVPCTQATCTMYFSVQLGPTSAMNNVTYTVTASVVRGGASYTTLLQGIPTYGILPSNSFAYYTADIVIANASQANGVSLTLSPVRPDVNMFVNFVGTPGAGNSTFNASTATGVDYVYIPRSYISSIAQGRSRISIYVAITTGTLSPPSATAGYFLTFKDNDDQVVELLPNVPVQKQVRPGGSDYYYLTAFAPNPNDRGNSDLTFALTSNNDGGDVGLYMSPWGFLNNQTDYRPGPSTGSCANSTGDGSDWIIIPASNQPAPPGVPANAYAPQCQCTAFPCNYLVTVFCGQTTRCSYTLRATIGDATPNAAPEGVAQTFPILPGRIVYYSIDARQAVLNQRNITVSVGPTAGRATVYIWATNKFQVGLTDPSFLPSPTAPGTFFNMWSNFPVDSNTPPNPLVPGQQALPSINIGWQDAPSDASGSYNLTTNPIITVGISTFYVPNGPGSSGISVTPRFLWFSQGGAPIQLTLGVTSPNVYVTPPSSTASLGGRNNFIAIYGDGSTTNPLFTQDWLIYAESSVINPQVVLVVSFTGVPNCQVVAAGGNSQLVCDAPWFTLSSSSGGSGTQPGGLAGVAALTLPAANRCGTANPLSTGGCPSNTTQNGVVYISVFSYGNTNAVGPLVQVTATTAVTAIQLSESTSITLRATNQNQPTFSFSTQPSASTGSVLPVAYYLTTTDTPVTVSINYCSSPISATTCDISKRQPTPSNNLQTFTVPAGQTQILTLRSGNSAYCSQLSLGSFCLYYVNVAPATTSCDTRVSATCGSFTIMPTVQNGQDPALFNFAQVANKVTGLTQQQMPLLGQLYGFGFDLNAANTLTVALDACAGYPALYACNPNPDPQGTCANNFKPSPSNYNHFAFPAKTGGRDYLYMTNVVNTPTVFSQMLADPVNPGTQPTFNMLFSVSTGYFLHVGTDPSNPNAQTNVTTKLDGNSSDIIVTWPDAMILRVPGFQKVTNGPMIGVTYTVYVALGGFGSSAIVNSACGLAAWQANGGNGQVLTTNGTQVTVQGINRNQYYEINVVVSCNAACMNANLPPTASEEMRTNMRSLSFANGRMLQTGYSTPDQTTAFVAIDFNSKSGGGGNNGVTTTVDPVIIGGAVGGAVGACCLISIIFMCVRRRRTSTPVPSSSSTVKADDRAKRVAQLGLGASSPQMSAPSAVAAADAGAARGDRASFEPVAGTAGQNWK